MLASIPIQPSQRYQSMDWPLNELEENMMTLATSSQIKVTTAWHQHKLVSSAVRCEACHRKFHSVGNLANHQQLYQH
ncbi:uncharacterized protein EV154DRAFT_512356 [Mucor mucedo]|uniref:C2H2-type domain-containing protein n=1 Tax=Mucor saturninus TaxID=64648 RepID=A0A8H7R1Z9_9FUNG|nr:uncharacterized protein EV154DRAFT_512356 [Mucor mucedo]KAG2202420.1 hypothetical protein INT47_008891 [Mucor saturninus]KAI7890066.1 hypothetical protein EV154DRAFT_512356 [Mucor mucedo]